jgi:exonuclease III
MRILTWNCNGKFREKYKLLDEVDADVVVIQECENPQLVTSKIYQDWAKNYLWTGDNKNKGVGIFAKEGISLQKLDWDISVDYGASKTGQLKYFIPCSIDNRITLIGAWCYGTDLPTFGYIGQFWLFLQKHKSKMTQTIIAGDFNSNEKWDREDRWWNHSDVVRELDEIDIESVYHFHTRHQQGKEKHWTYFQHRHCDNPKKCFHIDYIFMNKDFLKDLKTFEIGESKKWIKSSDHMPMWCEIP